MVIKKSEVYKISILYTKKEKFMVVELKNVSYSYGNKKVLNNISFEIKKGEIVGIVGRNGSGKTTLFNCMQGIRTDYFGSSKIFNIESKTSDKQFLKRIGVQFQSNNFFNKIKVGELLEFIASLYNISISREEILLQLEKVNLKEHVDYYVSELSGGQQQRVSLITSLINEPDILFLDEPTLGLDVQTRKELWALIKKLKEKGQTIILTTHYLNEIEGICDRIIMINDGNVIVDISLDEVFKEFPYSKKIEFNIQNFKLDKQLQELEESKYLKIGETEEIILTDSVSTVLEVISKTLNKEVDELKGVVISDVTLEDIFLLKTGGKIHD